MIADKTAVEFILNLAIRPLSDRSFVLYVAERYPEIFLEANGIKVEPTMGTSNPMNIYLSEHDANQILLYMYSGEKVWAVKHLRVAKLSHGLSFGLKEAKDILDNLQHYLYSIGKVKLDYPDAHLGLTITQCAVLNEIKRSI